MTIKTKKGKTVLFVSKDKTIKETVEEAIQAGADLRWADLRGADLAGADLREANLRWVDLAGADLAGADLREANLRWVDLAEANLREADLRGANLRGADLRWVDLAEANLRGADLIGADLRRADLRGADLRDVDLDFSCWPLWCGSQNVKVDINLVYQLLAHVACLDCDDEEYPEILAMILPYAQKSHRARDLKIDGENNDRRTNDI